MIIIYKFAYIIKFIALFPQIKKEVKNWYELTFDMPEELAVQARASLEKKLFHCLGGCIYALYPNVNCSIMLKAIVALQTISDYLDNLCDRVEVNNSNSFRQLHKSFTDALDNRKSLTDYYAFYPYHEDNYLKSLVLECRNQISKMPYYENNRDMILTLAQYYCELQTLKHITPNGEILLQQWINHSFSNKLRWNEWAAATGSTLGIFQLFALSFSNNNSHEQQHIFETYFPWMQSLHIMLDYLIDRQEDAQYGDLNFTFYYPTLTICASRLHYIYLQTKKRVRHLSHPHFHELVLQGLISLYGSDPKLKTQKLTGHYNLFLRDPTTKLLYNTCLLLRKFKQLA